MKRKLGLLLSVVLTLMMIMGMGTTAMAATNLNISDLPSGSSVGPFYIFAAPIYLLNDCGEDAYVYVDNDDHTIQIRKTYMTGCSLTIYTLGSGDLKSAVSCPEGQSYRVAFNEFVDSPAAAPATSVAPGHVHNFVWGTIIEPTIDHDGLEGEACSCGATRNTQPISAYAYAMEQYAYNKVANTGAGNTCVLEMGTMDTYPKRFMEAIAPSVLRGVTVELRFKSNQKLTKIQIPGGSVVDTSFDWYGVNKLKELYTEIQ